MTLGVLFATVNCVGTTRAVDSSGDLICRPQKLYRSDTLVVELPMRHAGFDFAIMGPQLAEHVISFKPGRADKIGPVIPARRFAAMKRIRIDSATVRGSVFSPWRRPHESVVAAPPKPIFTATASYEVLLGADLGNDDGDFDACWVDYFDYPRPERHGDEPRSIETSR